MFTVEDLVYAHTEPPSQWSDLSTRYSEVNKNDQPRCWIVMYIIHNMFVSIIIQLVAH